MTLHAGCLRCDAPIVTRTVKVACRCGFSITVTSKVTKWQLPGEPTDPARAGYRWRMRSPPLNARENRRRRKMEAQETAFVNRLREVADDC